ncbi:LytTR family two component transcriptional regulator [Chitinophaga niastensis]|uniref:LytTR family two component transcriptional regulator n=1 Tax=Chitinophaga niastensis TaxID=536980 RepID=A0A2P8HGY4_CHINA|nr:LytTR family DNA-binding domain-containing protein [Chitinophaga niastensis]PSL45473.1 LytTR family two component transcriptional regulator [Chitinophaga niastensis]
MIRTLIIDDEPAIRKDLEWLIKRYPDFIVLGSCGSIAEARVIIPNTEPELLLLDIELADGTGFELLQEFPERNFKVIFITAYNQHAIKAIKFGAYDYLLKPVDEDELTETLLRLKAAGPSNAKVQMEVTGSHLHNKKPGLHNRIVLRSHQYLQVVSFEEILYCQSDGSYTTFHLSDKRKITVSRPIKEYEELLPENWFIRIHQSYIVNHHFIDRFLKDGLLILKDGTQIPVSSRKREYVRQFLTGDH